MRKSLYTVTKRENIQATQQLNSTNEPGDKRKAESQPEVFAGKSKRDRKYQLILCARQALTHFRRGSKCVSS